MTSPSTSQAEEAAYFVSPKYSRELKELAQEGQDHFDVLVHMKKQADTKAAIDQAKDMRSDDSLEIRERKALLGALKQASSSQDGILKYLALTKKLGQVEEYESFYIINAIQVKAEAGVIEEISKRPEVDRIDLNQKIENSVPVEKKKPKMGRFNFDDQEMEFNLKQIEVDKARRDFGAQGEGSIVGILDTTVDYAHPAIKENFIGYNSNGQETNFSDGFYDAVESKLRPVRSDDMQHGTHCTGIMLGQEKDSKGNPFNIIGVAPKAKWLNARVFDNKGRNTASGFLRAAEWMLAPNGKAEHTPDAINNSWGGGAKADVWFTDSIQRWRDAGIVPVFASGNTGSIDGAVEGSVSNPGNTESAFTVGAVDDKNVRAYFSNRGPSSFPNMTQFKPDVVAPGVSIRSSVKDGYMCMSGTSMAAPHVTGMVALLKGENSSLTVGQIEDIIKSTTTPLTDKDYPNSPNHGYGSGLVNAYDAIAKAMGSNVGSFQGIIKVDGVPALGQVEIVGRNKSVSSDPTTGKYRMNIKEGSYEVRVTAYGCNPVTDTVVVSEGSINKDFNLSRKYKTKLIGNVSDPSGNPIQDVRIRLLEDSNVQPVKTDANGSYELADVYSGDYTLVAYAEGKEVLKKPIQVRGTNPVRYDLTLANMQSDFYFEEMAYDNGRMNQGLDNNVYVGTPRIPGVAVKFIPTKKNGTLSEVSVNFYQENGSNKKGNLKLTVYQLDERGRKHIVVGPKIVPYNDNRKLVCRLLDEGFKTDRPFFVSIEKANRKDKNFIVANDSSGNIDNSYIFDDGNFIPLVEDYSSGSLMIRAKMRYRQGEDEIANFIPKPTVKIVLPEENKIVGKAQGADTINLVFPGNRRQVANVDQNKDYNVVPNVELRPGDEILIYAKNFDGISSERISTIVRTSPSKLRDQKESAASLLDGVEDQSLKAEISAEVANASSLLEEADRINRAQEVSSSQVKKHQEKMDASKRKLAELINNVNPLKRELYQHIVKMRKLLEETEPSYDGEDIWASGYYIRDQLYTRAGGVLEGMETLYNKEDATDQELREAINNLKGENEYFEGQRKPGKMPLFPIDRRYPDGTYLGAAKDGYNSTNTVSVTIKDGRITKIELIEWHSGEYLKGYIIRDGYLDRIVDENRLDAKRPDQYRVFCICITDAIQDALKDNRRPLMEDRYGLNLAYMTAVNTANGPAVSQDGQALDKDWVKAEDKAQFEQAINAFKQALDKPEDQYDKNEVDDLYWKLLSAQEKFLSKIHEFVNKPGLAQAISNAEAELAVPAISEGGKDVGDRKWVSQAEKQAFQDAINASKEMLAKEDASKAEVEKSIRDLNKAKKTFKEAYKDPVKEEPKPPEPPTPPTPPDPAKPDPGDQNKPIRVWHLGVYIMNQQNTYWLRTPKGEPRDQLKWISLNEDIATVSKYGRVYPKKAGFMKVKATYKNKVFYYIMKIKPNRPPKFEYSRTGNMLNFSWELPPGAEGIFIYKAKKNPDGSYTYSRLDSVPNYKGQSASYYIPLEGRYCYKITAYKWMPVYKRNEKGEFVKTGKPYRHEGWANPNRVFAQR